jgi:hypothetical protein
MSITKTLFDISRLVPETGETDWGGQVTAQLTDLLDGADAILLKDGSDNIMLRLQPATSSLGAGATLTPTAPVHLVAGSGAAVTLGGITAGTKTGQILILVGTDNTNTVSFTYSATVRVVNGDVTLRLGEAIALIYLGAGVGWTELWRSA